MTNAKQSSFTNKELKEINRVRNLPETIEETENYIIYKKGDNILLIVEKDTGNVGIGDFKMRKCKCGSIKFTEELFKEFREFVIKNQHCFMSARDIIEKFGKIPDHQGKQFEWDYMDWLKIYESKIKNGKQTQLSEE